MVHSPSKYTGFKGQENEIHWLQRSRKCLKRKILKVNNHSLYIQLGLHICMKTNCSGKTCPEENCIGGGIRGAGICPHKLTARGWALKVKKMKHTGFKGQENV